LDTQKQILSESEVAVLAAADELYSKTDLLSLKKKSSYAATVDLPDPHPVILSHRRLGQPLATPWAACYLVSICLARLLPVEVDSQYPLVHLAHHRPELVSTGLTRRYHRLAHLPSFGEVDG
jgi:hypothetical protein